MKLSFRKFMRFLEDASDGVKNVSDEKKKTTGLLLDKPSMVH